MKKYKAYRFDGKVELNALVDHYGKKHFIMVPEFCENGYLYEEAAYGRIDDGAGSFTSASNLKASHYNDLEEVPFSHLQELNEPSLLEQVKLATSLLGKTGSYGKSLRAKIAGYKLILKGESSSMTIDDLLKTRSFVVALTYVGEVFITPLLLTNVDEPLSKDIKLNDSYTAKVFKDKVEVGCQSFTRQQVQSILNAMDNLK